MSQHPVGPQARDLTDQEIQLRAEEAYAINERIKEGLRDGRRSLWRVGEGFVAFDELRGWLALGYEGITDWLADPDIQTTRSTYYRLKDAYKYLASKGLTIEDMADLDLSKVDIVLPKVKCGEVTMRNALADTRALAASDLREKYLSRLKVPNVGTSDSDPDPDPSDGDLEGTAHDVPVSAATGDPVDPGTDWPAEPDEAPGEDAATKVADFIVNNSTMGFRQAHEMAPGLVALATKSTGTAATANGDQPDARQRAIDWLSRLHDDEKAFNRIPTKYRHEAEQILLDAGLLG